MTADPKPTRLPPDIVQRIAEAAPLRDRAVVAAQYRLACSPHEWTAEDGEAMARYVLAASWALEAISARMGPPVSQAPDGSQPTILSALHSRFRWLTATPERLGVTIGLAMGSGLLLAIWIWP